jgi:hypothetical protein
MPVRFDAEVICDRCGKRARCTVDANEMWGNHVAGSSLHGLSGWYHRENEMACSEACMTILKQDTRYGGHWKACKG